MDHLLGQFPHDHHRECYAQFHEYWGKVFVNLKKRASTKYLWRKLICSYMHQGSIGREEERRKQKPCVILLCLQCHGWFLIFVVSLRSHSVTMQFRATNATHETNKQVPKISEFKHLKVHLIEGPFPSVRKTESTQSTTHVSKPPCFNRQKI